jgi:putative ABC transport system permease protein
VPAAVRRIAGRVAASVWTVSIDPGWPVAAALALLLLIALAAHRISGYGMERPVLVAALRAIIQLGVAALVIAAVVDSLPLSVALIVVMFAMGVLTTSRRVEAPRAWSAAAQAMAAGVLPVLAVVLATGTIPPAGIALIPIAGIIVGNAMTAHTLVGRRAFAALREEHAQYEACLSLGLLPSQAIREIIHRRAPEALLPGLDQVKTTGVVTLPGAFIGVMLGGGTPVQAATAQVLVLFGIMAAQTVTVGVAERLVAARRLVPADLRTALVD